MRTISTMAVFVCLLTMAFGAHAQGFSPEEEQLMELVNEARAAAGVGPLQSDALLGAVARSHSLDMARNQFFSHVSPTTGDMGDRLRAAEVPYRRAGENIAFDVSVEGAHEAFMNSPHHHENVVNPEYTHLGVGIVRVGERMMVTQCFMLARDAEPAPAPAPTPAPVPAAVETPEPAGPAAEEPAEAADEVETQPGEVAQAQRPQLLPLPELPSPFGILESLATAARRVAPAPAPAPAEPEQQAQAAPAPAETAESEQPAQATPAPEADDVAAAPEATEESEAEAPAAETPSAPGPGLWIVTEDGSWERVELGPSALSRLLRLL